MMNEEKQDVKHISLERGAYIKAIMNAVPELPDYVASAVTRFTEDMNYNELSYTFTLSDSIELVKEFVRLRELYKNDPNRSGGKITVEGIKNVVYPKYQQSEHVIVDELASKITGQPE